MNRDEFLIHREQILSESIRQKDMVMTLPENTPLLFTYRSYSNIEKKWMDSKVAVFTTNVWNLTSIKCYMVACDTHTWEWDHDMHTLHIAEETGKEQTAEWYSAFGRHPLKFQYIKAWEPLDPKMLPLLISYPIKYPRFYTLLKGTQ